MSIAIASCRGKSIYGYSKKDPCKLIHLSLLEVYSEFPSSFSSLDGSLLAERSFTGTAQESVPCEKSKEKQMY